MAGADFGAVGVELLHFFFFFFPLFAFTSKPDSPIVAVGDGQNIVCAIVDLGLLKTESTAKSS